MQQCNLFGLPGEDISATLEGAASRNASHQAMHKLDKLLAEVCSMKEKKIQETSEDTCPSPFPAECPCPGIFNEYAPTHLGFSKGSGSFRALPTGFFSASSAVTK